jgi:probable O-glycosylation ligase (exosortase A-associated)
MGLYLLLKSPYRLQLALGGALVLIPVLLLLPQKWYDRMETIQNYQEDSSAMGRIYAWQFTGRLVQARPVLGGGFEPYTAETYQRYAPDIARLTARPQGPHSNYFKVLGEHGPIGLLLYLATGVLAWRKAGWIIRRTKGRGDLKWASDLAAMIQVSIVGYAVAGAFLGMTYFDLYYHLLAVLVLLPVILQPQLAQAPRAAEGATEKAVGAGALPGATRDP